MSPLTYAASLKPSNPDVLTYWDAMASANAPGFWQAMQDKISSLVAMNTWEPYPKAHALTSGHCILPGTWTFKRKRYPNVPSVNSRPATASAATSPTLRCSKTTAPPLLLPTALALPPGQTYCHQVKYHFSVITFKRAILKWSPFPLHTNVLTFSPRDSPKGPSKRSAERKPSCITELAIQ